MSESTSAPTTPVRNSLATSTPALSANTSTTSQTTNSSTYSSSVVDNTLGLIKKLREVPQNAITMIRQSSRGSLLPGGGNETANSTPSQTTSSLPPEPPPRNMAPLPPPRNYSLKRYGSDLEEKEKREQRELKELKELKEAIVEMDEDPPGLLDDSSSTGSAGTDSPQSPQSPEQDKIVKVGPVGAKRMKAYINETEYMDLLAEISRCENRAQPEELMNLDAALTETSITDVESDMDLVPVAPRDVRDARKANVRKSSMRSLLQNVPQVGRSISYSLVFSRRSRVVGFYEGRVKNEVSRPMVDIRASSDLVFDWNGVPNPMSLKVHFLKEGRLSIEAAERLLNQAVTVLANEPNVLQLSAPVNIFGDIHGQFYDLVELMNRCPQDQFLFLGDYVDRGYFSAEVCFYLLALKIKFPQRVHLLRGNHETFNFFTECKKKYNEEIYNLLMKCFEALPLAALVSTSAGQFFCLHGGLSPHISTIDDIQELERFTDVPNSGAFCDLLWSDPLPVEDEDTQFTPNTTRGCSYRYGMAAVVEFEQDNNIVCMVRGHEVQEEGYKEHRISSRELPPLITVFSAPNYCGSDNRGAAMRLESSGNYTFTQIRAVTSPYYLPNFMDAINFSVPYVALCSTKAYAYLLAFAMYHLSCDEDGVVSGEDQVLHNKLVATLRQICIAKSEMKKKAREEYQRMDIMNFMPSEGEYTRLLVLKESFPTKSCYPSSTAAVSIEAALAAQKKRIMRLFHSKSDSFSSEVLKRIEASARSHIPSSPLSETHHAPT